MPTTPSSQPTLLEALRALRLTGEALLISPTADSASRWYRDVEYMCHRVLPASSPLFAYLDGLRDSLTSTTSQLFVDSCLQPIRQLEQALASFAERGSPPQLRLFLGHGQNVAWMHVHHFLVHELDVCVEAFESHSHASWHISAALAEMINRCNAAVIVMTADDEINNGHYRARQNVVHEIGFTQGTYGQHRVIIFQEEGVDLFSNMSGIVSVRFSAKPESGFYDLRRAISNLTKDLDQ